MLDGFLVILIAVAIPAYLLNWFVGNRRKMRSDKESEDSRALTDHWLSVLPASSDEIRLAAHAAMYDPWNRDLAERFIPTPDKMAAYYFDSLGLAQDFRAIYGPSWQDKVRIIPDPDAAPRKEGVRVPAVWRIEGFRPTETPEIAHAITALLLSRDGKVMNKTDSAVELNISVVPNDRKPWANLWFRRIEENLRLAGHNVDLYVCSREYEGYKTGAFFAPGPYLEKLDEQEDVRNEI